MKTIYLAGGCFWGVQKYLDLQKGVVSTVVGYANGKAEFPAPSYEQVKSQQSGHAETVKVEYDETVITLTELLEKYFLVIDPVSVNKQGGDVGISYRTGIYYAEADQLPDIEAVYAKIQAGHDEKLAVEVGPLENFYPAEEYHQKYLEKNPGGYCHIGACFLGG